MLLKRDLGCAELLASGVVLRILHCGQSCLGRKVVFGLNEV